MRDSCLKVDRKIMKVRLVSDLHLEFLKKGEQYVLPEVEADVLVLAGDIHVGSKADAFILHHLEFHDVVYVLGNHEFYGQLYSKLLWAFDKPTTKRINQRAEELGLKGRLYFLENNSVVINGVRFVGSTLWTDFDNGNPVSMMSAKAAMTDYRKIVFNEMREDGYLYHREMMTPELVLGVHRKSVSYLSSVLSDNFHGKTVVVTHHLPSRRSVSEKYKDDSLTPAYASYLDLLVEDSGADFWLHGHTHSSSDYLVGDTRVVANPRGYPGLDHDLNVGYNDELVLEV